MIALMIAIKHVSTPLFAQNLDIVLKECFPEIHQFQEMKGTPFVLHIDPNNHQQTKIQRIRTHDARLSDFRSSERKEQLRLTQLYDEVNVLEYFQQNIKVWCIIHCRTPSRYTISMRTSFGNA